MMLYIEETQRFSEKNWHKPDQLLRRHNLNGASQMIDKL